VVFDELEIIFMKTNSCQRARRMACVAKYGPLVMSCAPRGLAPPVWRWAHRMEGLKKLISWFTALISTGGLEHQAPWAPEVDFLFADENRQDKQ
jgi:hypothetical protein